MNYIEEEISLFEFSKRFLNNEDMNTPAIFQIDDLNIEVETLDNNGDKCFTPIKSFVVKGNVPYYYTDGNIDVTEHHRFIINNKNIFPTELPQFVKINETMNVVDIEVPEFKSYLANGYLNHNTTSGGKSVGFTASVRLKTSVIKKIKGKINGVESEVGNVVEVKVVKNRLGPPGRKVTFNIYYESGIDDLGSFLDCLKDIGIIKTSGSQYSFEYINPETGEQEKHTFMRREFQDLVLDRPDLEKYLYDKLCDLYIMKYQVDQQYTDVHLEDGDE